MDAESHPPFLIADPDMDFLQTIRADPQARTVPPTLTHNEDSTLRALKSTAQTYAAFFFNPKLAFPHGIPMIHQALKNHPATPIFCIADSAGEVLQAKELQGLCVRKVLIKPVRYPDMVKTLRSAQLAFSAEQALKQATGKADPLDQETGANDDDFLPISAAKFMSGSACFFDVYVKIKAGKYIKILQAGDAFTSDRVTAYVQKGLQSFYLRKETQEAYLKYCEHLSSLLIKNARAPVQIRVAATANQGEEVVSFLRNHGVDDTAVQHAQKFVDNVRTLTGQLKRQNNAALNRFLESIEKTEHGAAITILSSFLIQPLQFEAEKSVHLIGLASLLHDIGLQDMDPKFALENERDWNAEESLLYRTHPEKGAALLANIDQIEPTVVQAVLQHHERRSRTGFPNRIGAGALNRISEIVGICDEFHRLIHLTQGPKPIDLKLEIESAIYKEFSTPVLEAFMTAFKL